MAPLLLPLSTHRTASLFFILATAMAAGMFGNFACIPGVYGAGPSASSSTTWCVARSEASTQALQTALDYACGAGADCSPIQSNGLCYLPNTMLSHASYAFDSYYQRQNRAPGSCDFGGTATIALTDPSYGSCVYPSSSSTAGGKPSVPTMPFTPPSTSIPSGPPPPTIITPPGTGTTGSITGFTPGLTPIDDDSSASLASGTSILMTASFMLVLLFA